jgi:hypothetical protein
MVTMKKSFIVFLLMIFGVCFSQSVKDLYGKWSGADRKDNIGSFTFFSDGFTYVEYNGMVIDGRDYTIPDGPNQGKKGYVKYSVDFSATPYKFKLIISYNNPNNQPEEVQFLKGLIEFTNEKEFLFFIDFENTDPKSIDPLSQNTIVMRKDSN